MDTTEDVLTKAPDHTPGNTPAQSSPEQMIPELAAAIEQKTTDIRMRLGQLHGRVTGRMEEAKKERNVSRANISDWLTDTNLAIVELIQIVNDAL